MRKVLSVLLLVTLAVQAATESRRLTIRNIRYAWVVDTKLKTTPAHLALMPKSLHIYSGKTLQPFADIPYEHLVDMTYSWSKSPRWKEGVVAAVFLTIFAAPIFFMKRKHHWLTFNQTNGEKVMLKLNKLNYLEVIRFLAERTGKPVIWMDENGVLSNFPGTGGDEPDRSSP